MLKDLLREVVVFVVGKQAEPIAEILDSKKHVNEFNIAKKLEITINQARNILYKLADHGLVSSIRKKDKKKGWYTYFWRLEALKSLEFLRQFLERKIGELSSEIAKRETQRFYICETCKIEYEESRALLEDFICSECGEVFTVKDNSKDIRELTKMRDKFVLELSSVKEEVVKEELKIDKQVEKEVKGREKEKAAKRASSVAKRRATQAKNKKDAKKLENPKNKKVAKKKAVKKKVSSKKKVAKKKAVKKKASSKKKVAKKKAVKKKSSSKKKFKKKK